jgi:hypothetical protein
VLIKGRIALMWSSQRWLLDLSQLILTCTLQPKK